VVVEEKPEMKAIVFHGERRIDLVQVPDPTPGPDDVVIRIAASGMCGSDLHTFRGPRREAPIIAGHEPAGVVEAVGAGVPKEWIGRRVFPHHYFGCGRCDQCRTGWTQMCREGLTALGHQVPGAHAELVSVPFKTVIPMPDGLSFLAAAAIGCGTGTAWGALKRLELAGDDTIAVFGQGPVGLAATQLANAMGARVIALDISPSRLARAREFGAGDVINPAEVDSVTDAIRDINGGRGVSKSLETSGASSAASDALKVLDLWGRACWVGIGSTVNFDILEHLHRQITAMTSWTTSSVQLEACARYVVDKQVDVDALFTDRWSLEQFSQAYEVFEAQRSGKGVFIP
jgi:threonine dehydrogenase-like Zn-dependent dehydrogenase